LSKMMTGIGSLLTAPIMGPIIVGALAMGGLALVMAALKPWKDEMIAEAKAERARIKAQLKKAESSEEGSKEVLKELKDEKKKIKEELKSIGPLGNFTGEKGWEKRKKIQRVEESEKKVDAIQYQRREGTLDVNKQIENAKAKKASIVGTAARKEASGGFLGTGLFKSEKEKEDIAAVKAQAAKDAEAQDKIIKALESEKAALEKVGKTEKENKLIAEITKLESELAASKNTKSKGAFGADYRTATDEGETKKLQTELDATKKKLEEEKRTRFGLPSTGGLESTADPVNARILDKISLLADHGAKKGSLYTHDIYAEEQGEELVQETQEQSATLAESRDATEKLSDGKSGGLYSAETAATVARVKARKQARLKGEKTDLDKDIEAAKQKESTKPEEKGIDWGGALAKAGSAFGIGKKVLDAGLNTASKFGVGGETVQKIRNVERDYYERPKARVQGEVGKVKTEGRRWGNVIDDVMPEKKPTSIPVSKSKKEVPVRRRSRESTVYEEENDVPTGVSTIDTESLKETAKVASKGFGIGMKVLDAALATASKFGIAKETVQKVYNAKRDYYERPKARVQGEVGKVKTEGRRWGNVIDDVMPEDKSSSTSAPKATKVVSKPKTSLKVLKDSTSDVDTKRKEAQKLANSGYGVAEGSAVDPKTGQEITIFKAKFVRKSRNPQQEYNWQVKRARNAVIYEFTKLGIKKGVKITILYPAGMVKPEVIETKPAPSISPIQPIKEAIVKEATVSVAPVAAPKKAAKAELTDKQLEEQFEKEQGADWKAKEDKILGGRRRSRDGGTMDQRWAISELNDEKEEALEEYKKKRKTPKSKRTNRDPLGDLVADDEPVSKVASKRRGSQYEKGMQDFDDMVEEDEKSGDNKLVVTPKMTTPDDGSAGYNAMIGSAMGAVGGAAALGSYLPGKVGAAAGKATNMLGGKMNALGLAAIARRNAALKGGGTRDAARKASKQAEYRKQKSRKSQRPRKSQLVSPSSGSTKPSVIPSKTPLGPMAMPKAVEVSKLEDSSGLGSLSERYESGGRGAGVVSSGRGDYGGASYGTYQMASRGGRKSTAGKFVKQSQWADQFEGLQPGSKEFSNRWKQIAQDDPSFKDAQHGYIKKTHYDPLAQKTAAETGLDVNSRSKALQDVVWSTGVQHGSGTNVMRKALAGKDAASMSDDEIIKAVYAERGKTDAQGNLARFKSSSKGVQKGVANRYQKEQEDALAALEKEKASKGQQVAKAQEKQVTKDVKKNVQSQEKETTGQKKAITKNVQSQEKKIAKVQEATTPEGEQEEGKGSWWKSVMGIGAAGAGMASPMLGGLLRKIPGAGKLLGGMADKTVSALGGGQNIAGLAALSAREVGRGGKALDIGHLGKTLLGEGGESEPIVPQRSAVSKAAIQAKRNEKVTAQSSTPTAPKVVPRSVETSLPQTSAVKDNLQKKEAVQEEKRDTYMAAIGKRQKQTPYPGAGSSSSGEGGQKQGMSPEQGWDAGVLIVGAGLL